MSQISSEYTPYFSSGEINSTVADREAAIERLRAQFPDAEVEEFDGLTFSSRTELVVVQCSPLKHRTIA
jgi:phosphomannomutase